MTTMRGIPWRILGPGAASDGDRVSHAEGVSRLDGVGDVGMFS
jgi:hypothetical protein